MSKARKQILTLTDALNSFWNERHAPNDTFQASHYPVKYAVQFFGDNIRHFGQSDRYAHGNPAETLVQYAKSNDQNLNEVYFALANTYLAVERIEVSIGEKMDLQRDFLAGK